MSSVSAPTKIAHDFHRVLLDLCVCDLCVRVPVCTSMLHVVGSIRKSLPQSPARSMHLRLAGQKHQDAAYSETQNQSVTIHV